MAHPSFCFFIVCTEVNAYLDMKYFLKTDDSFMNFRKHLAKELIQNSYINDNTSGIPSNIRKRKILHILDTAPIHYTDYNKNVFARKNINTNNTSVVGRNLKTNMNVLLIYLGSVDVKISSPYECYCDMYRQQCNYLKPVLILPFYAN